MSLILHGTFCRNFGPYKGEHSLRFRKTPGLFFVHGENRLDPELGSNDSGKTTLFNLIAWVVYGKTLRDGRPGASIETWDKDGPTVGGLTFQRDENYFRIERGRNPNSLRIKENQNEWEDCEQARIEDIWPLSFDAFKCTIILPQLMGENRLFLDMSAEEQSQLTSVGLDIWLDAAENAGKVSKVAHAELDGCITDIARNEGALLELRQQIAVTSQAFDAFEADVLAQHKEVVRKIRAYEDEAIELKRKAKPLPEDIETRKLEEGLRECEKNMDMQANLETQYGKEITEIERTMERAKNAIKLYKTKKCPECGQEVEPELAAAKLKELVASHARLIKRHAAVTSVHDELGQIDLGSTHAQLTEAIAESAADYNRRTLAQRTIANRLEFVSAEKGTLYAQRKKLETQPNPHKASLDIMRKRAMTTASTIAKLQKQKGELEYQVAAYDYWRDGFRRIRLDLIDECLRGLEVLSNEAAEQLGLSGWRLELATEQETTSGKLVRKMGVFLYPPGMQEPVRWQSYGGGVSQRWQLALRFALSELLLSAVGLEPSIEILDEPTAHLSPEGVDALMLYLRERAQRLNREIWVVEHHQLDESLFDATLNVVKTVAGSKATWSDAYEPLTEWDPAAEPWLTVTPEGI